MKNFFRLIFAFTILSFVSCGSDDCSVDSFVGVYSGSVNCPNEPTATGTLTITKISDTTIKVIDPDSAEFTFTVSDCVASTSVDFFGVMVTQTLTLDGDKIDYVAESSVAGISEICTGSMTRQ